MYKATKEQIEAWKKEHGDVFRFKSEKHDKAVYCRKPKRNRAKPNGANGMKTLCRVITIVIKNLKWLNQPQKVHNGAT